jgi:hypothetical protein
MTHAFSVALLLSQLLSLFSFQGTMAVRRIAFQEFLQILGDNPADAEQSVWIIYGSKLKTPRPSRRAGGSSKGN